MTKKIKKIKPFIGNHCETTATGTLLKQLGINFSEPMLFGIGMGLGFIFWNMKIMDFPFIGGRIKPDMLTKNIVDNLNLKLVIKETTSVKKAWENVKNYIDNDIVVGLKLDCYYLDYFTNKIHFAAHYVSIYDYDEKYAYLIDTKQQGGKVKTTLKNLQLARNEKGPMSSKNLSYIIELKNNGFDIKKVLFKALKSNAKDYLNPPIKNIGYKGILKTSEEIKKWFKNSKDIKRDFKTTAMLMERAGTGGALFRNLYRDFLKESYKELKNINIKKSYDMFVDIAKMWTEISMLFDQVGETKNIKYINKASEYLKIISEKEKTAMNFLLKI